MSTPLAGPIWPACLSALQLDRLLAGELDELGAWRVRDHLGRCPSCSAALESMRAARDEPLPRLRAVPPAPRRRRWLHGAAAGAAIAAAASIFVVLRPAGERVKGAGFGLHMYVEHGGRVRRAFSGDAVRPGDAVRFAVSAPVSTYVAILSLDAVGRASVYFPAGFRAEPVTAGSDVALPLATRLDATVGEERIVGLFCASAVDLEPLRARLERDAVLEPEGCQVIRWSFVKR